MRVSKEVSKVQIEPGRFASETQVGPHDESIHEKPHTDDGVRMPAFNAHLFRILPHPARIKTGDHTEPPDQRESQFDVRHACNAIEESVLRGSAQGLVSADR